MLSLNVSPLNGTQEMAKLSATAFILTVIALGVTPSYAQTFNVCEGEYWETQKGSKCLSHEAYTYRGTIDGWAATTLPYLSHTLGNSAVM